MSQPRLYKVASSSFIFREGKLLVLKRGDDEDFLPGYWETAGGGIDDGESIEQGLIREVKEEAGIDVVARKIIGYFEYIDGLGTPTINLNFICEMKNPGQEPNVALGEMTEARWINEDQISALHMTPVMQKVCHEAFTAYKQ